MTKAGFIKLLEQYKFKAFTNFHAEVRATAITLIPQDLLQRMNEMTNVISALKASHEDVNRLLTAEESISELFGADARTSYGSVMRYSKIERRDVADLTIQCIMSQLERRTPYYKQKEDISKKFDDAISRAKKLNSTTALTELARLLEIPLGDDDTVTPDAKTMTVLDVPFVKQEIKKATMLA